MSPSPVPSSSPAPRPRSRAARGLAAAVLGTAILLPAAAHAQRATPVALAYAPAAAAPAGATTPVRPDSGADSSSAARRLTMRPVATRHHSLTPLLYYGALAAGVGGVFEFRVDPDPGGYRDGWRTEAMFPDKGVHALAAFALTSVGVDLGARPFTAAASVCAAGVAFEYSQGYVSRYDIGADCLAATTAALWRKWTEGRRRD